MTDAKGPQKVKPSDAKAKERDDTRRLYSPPVVSDWGTVADLTRGALGGTEDFPPTFDGTQTI